MHRVELTVRETNASAIALYRKAGFAVEGLQRSMANLTSGRSKVTTVPETDS